MSAKENEDGFDHDRHEDHDRGTERIAQQNDGIGQDGRSDDAVRRRRREQQRYHGEVDRATTAMREASISDVASQPCSSSPSSTTTSVPPDVIPPDRSPQPRPGGSSPSSAAPSAAAPPVVVVGESLTTQERENFLIFIKILFRILDDANEPHTTQMAKRIVLECRRKNQQGDPNYHPLMDAVERRLRRFIGEARWRRAHLFLHHYITTRRGKGRPEESKTKNPQQSVAVSS